MNRDRVIEVLRIMAEGVNPDTGEIMDDNSPYASPTSVRALFNAVEMLNSLPKKDKKAESDRKKLTREQKNREKGLPKNSYAPWNEVSDSQLKKLHGEGMNNKQIGEKMERQTSAIRSRLKKIGFI